ncbi:MAG: aldo/keto reductase [Deltaproteobacteria bacterium]|nr:aldo/keto reductase [Deltaproteobacteria bacterium]
MEHRALGKSGLKVSPLCLGAMTFGDSQGFMKGVTSTDEEARRILDASLDAGIDFVDTADVYGDGRSEELLGEWLEGRRQKIVLATKCRFPLGPRGSAGPNDRGLSRRHVIAACEASLRRLRTDWIDLYQTHLEDPEVPIEETLSALDDLVHAGKVRYVGCSNYSAHRLVESLWAADRRGTVGYESVQLQWSLVVRGAEREVVPACRAFGLGVLVWSPLAKGFLSGKYRRGEPAPKGSRLEVRVEAMRGLDADRSWSILEEVRAVAGERGTTPAAVALAWLLARPEVSSVIVGARTALQLRANLAATELELSVPELARLDDASAIEPGYPYDFIEALRRS